MNVGIFQLPISSLDVLLMKLKSMYLPGWWCLFNQNVVAVLSRIPHMYQRVVSPKPDCFHPCLQTPALNWPRCFVGAGSVLEHNTRGGEVFQWLICYFYICIKAYTQHVEVLCKGWSEAEVGMGERHPRARFCMLVMSLCITIWWATLPCQTPFIWAKWQCWLTSPYTVKIVY